MTTEKIRVNASSVIRSVDDMRAIATSRELSSIHESVNEALDSILGAPEDGHCVEHLKRAVASGSILWAIALPSAAIAAASHPHKATYAFALAVYGIGSVICHQLPQRSFHIAAVALPVCARCMGVYIGGAVASLLFAARR